MSCLVGGGAIIITTQFVNGVVQLSTQIANAISNGGYALFPAIVLDPKAAIIATLYSAIPAIISGSALSIWAIDPAAKALSAGLLVPLEVSVYNKPIFFVHTCTAASQ